MWRCLEKVNTVNSNYLAITKPKPSAKRTIKLSKSGITMFNPKEELKEIKARKKLDTALLQRKKGIKGLVRVMASPKAVQRLKRLKKYQIQKVKEAEQESKRKIIKKSLGHIHPLLKGITTNTPVIITYKNGVKREGNITNAIKEMIWVEIDSGIISFKTNTITNIKPKK